MHKENSKPFSILIIEDEDATRINYVKFLKRYYKNVYEARDGEEALHQYKLYKPEILNILSICSIFLPHQNASKFENAKSASD